jgi:GT2 family glycosyltransferase/glycosyltransferase involved in cell wall biosynthesis
LPDNRGFGAACNIGAAGSTADYLLFLNPDTVLDRDTLSGAVAFMEIEGNAQIAASTVRLRDSSGVTQRCCARFPTVGRMVAQSIGLDRLLPRLFPPHFLLEWDHEQTRPVEQVMGAFLLIRRSAFTRLSGFDERFFVYYEDVDLCRQIALAGWNCVHNAAVSAVHVGCGTTNQIKARRQFYGARSRIQYAQKYFGWPGALALALDGLFLAPLARIGKGAVSGSLEMMADALRGAIMLWTDLPNILFSGNKPAAQHRNEDSPLSVLALTRYPRQGASSRTRFLNYLPALKAAEIDVTVSPFFDEAYLPGLYGGKRPRPVALLKCYWRRLKALRKARSFDAIWIEKEALPWAPAGAELLTMRGVPFVLDFDDAWFHRYASHRTWLVRHLLGSKFETLVKRARLTVVGNDSLADWAHKAGAREILQQPTPVPLAADQPTPSPTTGGPLHIGWIGTPTTAATYLHPLLPMLAGMIQEGWASVTIIGAQGDDYSKIGATVLPWDEAREVEQLQSFDVGIMPLTDDPWSRGKCAYKLLQYMAVGLPVVASPVGMNCQVVQPGINGFLADSQEEWRKSLLRLAKDPALRRQMGETGRAIVAKDYSLEAVTPRLVNAFRHAAERP